MFRNSKRILFFLFFCLTFWAKSQISVLDTTIVSESCMGAKDGYITVVIGFPVNTLKAVTYRKVSVDTVITVVHNITNVATRNRDTITFGQLYQGDATVINIFGRLLSNSSTSPLAIPATTIQGLDVIEPSVGVGALNQNIPVCLAQTINLKSFSSNATGYLWGNANGFKSNLQNPSIANAKLTDAIPDTVYATAIGNQGKTCKSDPVTITPIITDVPLAAFTIPKGICNNTSTTLQIDPSASGADSYSWTMQNGTPSSQTGAGPFSVSYNTVPGNYNITLTTTKSGCTNALTKQLAIRNSPTGSITAVSNTVCNGANAQLQFNFTGIGPFDFTYSDGTSSFSSTSATTSTTINVVVTANTTFTLTSVLDQGCSGTITGSPVFITVNPLPTATLNPIQASICDNAASLSLSGTHSGTGGTEVFSGAGVTGSTFNPTGLGGTTSTITYTYTDGNGCSKSDSKNISIVSKPVVTISPLTNVCSNSSVVNLSATPTGGTFSGTGVSGTTFNPTGLGGTTQNITYSFTDVTGCSNTANTNVTIYTAPTATILTADTSLCIGASAKFNISFTGAKPWKFNYSDGTTTSAITTTSINPTAVIVTPNVTTNYSLISIADSNCTSGSFIDPSYTVNVKTLPVLTFSPVGGPYCVTASPITLVATPSNGSSTFTTTPSGAITGGNIFNPANAGGVGTKTITYTYTDAVSGCTNTAVQTVEIKARPTSTFTLPTTTCLNTNATANYTGNGSSSAVYTWDFNSPSSQTGAGQGPITAQWNVSGIKTVTLTVSEYSCTSTVSSKNILINTLPTVTITKNQGVCQGNNASLVFKFTGKSPWTYTYSNGSTNTTKTFSSSTTDSTIVLVPVASTTTFSMVSVTDGNGCVNNSLSSSILVTVVPKPSSDFTMAASVCKLSNTTIDYKSASSPTATYIWNFDGANVVSGSGSGAYQVNWSKAGNHIVTLVVNESSGCFSDTTKKTIIVDSIPTALVSNDTSVCTGMGAKVKLSFVGISPYQATITDQLGNLYSINTASNVVYVPVNLNVNSTYTLVPNTVFDAKCQGTGSGSVQVNLYPLPSATISNDSQICEGSNANVKLNFVGTSPFNYTYTDGVSSFTGTSNIDSATVVVKPSVTSTYTISSIADKFCSGTGAGSAIVTVVKIPVADFTIPNATCINLNALIKFTGNGGLSPIYNWNFDNGTINTDSVQVKFNVAWNTFGVKNVSLSVSDRGCSSSTTTKQITINNAPTGTIVSNDTTICSNRPANLKINFTGLPPFVYTYTDGITTSSSISTNNFIDLRSVNPQVNSTYKLISLSDGACTATSLSGDMDVAVNVAPSSNFTAKTGVCENEVIDVVYTGVNQGAASFDWGNFAGANIISGTNSGPYKISYPNTSTNNVRLIVSENGCSDTTTTKISVTPKPTAAITGDTSICSGNSTNLKLKLTGNLPLYTTISNYGIDTSVVLSDLVSVNPTISTLYSITNIVDFNGCVGSFSGSANVIVNENPQFTFTGKTDVCKNDSAEIYLNVTSAQSPWLIETTNFVPVLIASKTSSLPNDTLKFIITADDVLFVKVTDANNCSTTASNSLTVTLKDFPNVDFNLDSAVCINATTTVTNNDENNPLFTYSIAAPNATVVDKGQGSFELTYPVVGKQYVEYTVFDGVCSSNVDLDSIIVNSLPDASMQILQSKICSSDTVDVTVNFVGQKNYDFKINVEGNSLSDVLNYASDVYTFKTPFTGTGKIALEYLKDGNGCINSVVDTFTVTINPKPNIVLTGLLPVYCIDNTLTTITANLPVTFDFTGLPTNSFKDLGNGVAELYPNIASAGNFPFKMTFTNSFGCTDTQTPVLNVLDFSDAHYDLPLHNCHILDSVVTQFTVRFGSYSTDIPGLSYNPTTGNILPVKSTPGTYLLTHTLSLGGCPKGVYTDTVIIHDSPRVPQLQNIKDTIICKQTRILNDYILSNPETGVNYTWSFDNNLGIISNLVADGSRIRSNWLAKKLGVDTLRITAHSQFCTSDTLIKIYTDTVYSQIINVSDSTLNDAHVILDFESYATFPKYDTVFIASRPDSSTRWKIADKQVVSGKSVYITIPDPSTSLAAWQYGIAVKNYCGDTVYYNSHKIIKVDGSGNEITGQITLDFNKYIGWKAQKYEIWRQLGTQDTFKLYSIYENLNSDTSFTFLDATQDNRNQCFRVKAIYDSTDVTKSDLVSYSNIKCFKFKNTPKIFNVFTPNGDGVNENLYVENIRSYPSNQMYILNRWGSEVYSKENYNNDWDGGELPAGTYFYIFKINDKEENKTYEFKGSVLIVR